MRAAHTVPHMRTLLLFYCILGASASELDPTLYHVNYNTYCSVLDNTPYSYLKVFVSTLDPVQPVTYSNGMITAMFPQQEIQRYQIEAVRGNGTAQCSFCPYHNAPDGPNPIIYGNGGTPYIRSPMYGPCLDRKQSVKIACAQNTLLFPPSFLGEYFYPDQIKMAQTAIANTDNFAEHRFIASEILQAGKAPTDFALGRGRLRENLLQSNFRTVNGNVVNETLTAQFFHDYLTTGVNNEGWALWAQHFCAPACHRNAEYFQVSVRESDWKGQSPILQYLNRKNADSTNLTGLTRCNLCPRFQAGYWWSNLNEAPIDQLTWNTVATTCHPWFGALPLLTAGTLAFSNLPVVTHGAISDGVVWPLTSTYAATVACPVNTYNDVCAQSIRYYARVANGNLVDSSLTQAQAAVKAACKPCPSGYHTDGKTGAWFCLPPAGQLLTNRAMLLATRDSNNESIAWSRRDTLGYEFECGYLLTHCVQCPLFKLSMLPDAFNQKMILEPLLKTEPCPSGQYCPHPLRVEPQQCPASKPYSPEGSWSSANCTCGMGTFLNAGACVPCPAWDSCPLGQYLKGLNQCTNQNGATSAGVCTACANKPATASYTGPGSERFVGSSLGIGVCPFTCTAGSALKGAAIAGSASTCFYTWQCLALKPFVTSNGYHVYAPGLLTLRDSLTVKTSGCTLAAELSNTMVDWASKPCTSSCPYSLVSTTCLGKGPCSRLAPCGVSQPATYGSDVVCSSCPAPPASASFTPAAQDQLISSGQMCQYTCDQANYYVNGSACQSCAALTSRVCGAGTWQVRGGGCLQNFTAFPAPPAVMDTSWCVSCTKQIADVPVGKYLNLEFCNFTVCERLLAGQTYRKDACIGTSAGSIANCTTLNECRPEQQYLAGACTADSTPVCTDCTTFKPGYHMVTNCTYNMYDAIWDLCPAGSYCDGGMHPPTPCPFPQTSLVGSKGDCFCPAGMLKVDSNNTCAPMVCPDAVVSRNAPGGNVRSASYMELDYTTLATKCSPCPGSSFTLDAHAVGIASCRCPLDSYLSAGDCVTCQSSCVGCWQGYCPASGSSAPFSLSSGQCAAGFDLLAGAPPSGGGTGSAAYVEEAASRLGWTVLYTSARFAISQLVVTSSRDDDGSLDALQIALFSIDSLNVYVKPLPPLDYGTADPLSSYAFWCPVSVRTQFTLAQIAVSRWPRLQQYTQLGATFNAQYSAYVGQVAYDLQDNSLLLFTNQVSLTDSGNPAWFTTDGCGAYKQRETLIPSDFYPNQTDVPAMQHQFAYPGGTTAANTFYVAFNDWSQGTCGVIAYNMDVSNTHTSLDLSQASKRRITAMAVLSSGMIPMLYLAFDTTPNSIRLIQWATSQAESDELFLTSTAGVVGLSYAWLSDQLLWARVLTGGGLSTTNVYTADRNYQRTFTQLEQMPLSSHPSLGPLVVGTGSQWGRMVAASGTTIFTLPINRCPPAYDSKGVLRARYWSADGSGCKMNTCVRGRSCAGALGRQYYNETMQRCMCNPGYFETQQLTCSDCVAGYYCANNQQTACGRGLTSNANARSEWGCVCGMGQLYRSSGCSNCPAGTWCPNQWESQTCPGNVDAARSLSTRSLYPYACVCAAGSTGPGCTPCPSGRYCPIVSGATTTNYALSLVVKFTAAPVAGPVICDIVRQRLVLYFQSSGAPVQIYCVFLPALTLRTAPLAVFMVQTASLSATDQLALIWANFTSPQGDFTAIATSTQMSFGSVSSNDPRECPFGKLPLQDGTGCQCAPGFETSAANQCAVSSVLPVLYSILLFVDYFGMAGLQSQLLQGVCGCRHMHRLPYWHHIDRCLCRMLKPCSQWHQLIERRCLIVNQHSSDCRRRSRRRGCGRPDHYGPKSILRRSRDRSLMMSACAIWSLSRLYLKPQMLFLICWCANAVFNLLVVRFPAFMCARYA